MRKHRFFILFVSAVLLMTRFVSADHRQHLFEQGNQFFQNNEYKKAVQAYEEILQMRYESAALYYNMGNSYYKLGESAKAILNYERALRLRPNDEDIQFNLQIANLSVVDKIPEIPELFYIKYFREFRSEFSVQTLTLLTLVIYLLFIGSLIIWLLKRSIFVRRFFKTTSFVLLIFLFFISFTFFSKILSMKRTTEAIVMSPEVDVRSSPSKDGTEIFSIHEGLKVKISDIRKDWYEIRLPDGKQGWLLTKEVEII